MDGVMNITEPTTMATDYVLALLCAVLATRLREKARQTKSRAMALWRWAFVATSVGALAGGSTHGFALLLKSWQWSALWKCSTLMIGCGSFCLLMAVSYARLGGQWGRGVRIVALLKLAVYVFWMLGHDDFRFVIFDYGSSMIIILGIETWKLWRERRLNGVWIPAGIVLSFVSSAIQQSGYSLHRHFNQNDLFHVIQMVALYFLYRGGMLLKDSIEKESAPQMSMKVQPEQ
jgi:MFS family permease